MLEQSWWSGRRIGFMLALYVLALITSPPGTAEAAVAQVILVGLIGKLLVDLYERYHGEYDPQPNFPDA